jgi:hypothetical protein
MPFDSPLSLAVVSNLRLYVKETLEGANFINANPARPLLHWAAYAVGNPSPYPLRGPLHEESLPTQAVDDLSEMVRLLFFYGGDKDVHYGGLTAFQLLFKGLFQNSEAPGGPDRKASMVNTARVFLENKQDPNVDIIKSMAIREEATWCKALHINWKDMTYLLLEFKADVNALDSSGLTPLDVCLGAGSSLCRLGEQREPIEALYIATLLLNSGGCATTAGLRAAGHFTRRLSGKLGYELDYRLRDPPLLENKVSLLSHSETIRQELIQIRSNQPKPRRMRNRLVNLIIRSRAGTKE